MAKGDIKLSQKYGVNPAIPKCFYCLKDKNEIILAGRLPGDAEAPRDTVWDQVPCPECAGFMQTGIIMVSVSDADIRSGHPQRTGCFAVVTPEAAERVFGKGEQLEGLLKVRFTYVPDSIWDLLGLPRENIDNRGKT